MMENTVTVSGAPSKLVDRKRQAGRDRQMLSSRRSSGTGKYLLCRAKGKVLFLSKSQGLHEKIRAESSYPETRWSYITQKDSIIWRLNDRNFIH